MDIDLAALPDDIDTLHRMISELKSARDQERSEAQAEIDRLRSIVKTLQRHQFGRRSERLDSDQLQLGLEDLDADIAGVEATLPTTADKLVKPLRSSDERKRCFGPTFSLFGLRSIVGAEGASTYDDAK